MQPQGADAFEPRVPALGAFNLFGPGNLRRARPERRIDSARLALGEVRIAHAIADALKGPLRAARSTANRVWGLIQVARRATAS